MYEFVSKYLLDFIDLNHAPSMHDCVKYVSFRWFVNYSIEWTDQIRFVRAAIFLISLYISVNKWLCLFLKLEIVKLK